MHHGVWKKVATGSREVRGKTLGVVGYGHIGSQVSILAEDLGMRVVFHDIAAKLPLGNSQPVKSLDALLEQSDFVTLHVPETPQTRGMIGAAAARPDEEGGLPDQRQPRHGGGPRGARAGAPGEATSTARRSTSTPRSRRPTAPRASRRRSAASPNVILTPHIGGSTVEAQEAIGREVSASLARFAHTGATLGSVNFPAGRPRHGRRTPGA